MNELKNADEIVRNLHECACEGCPADILDAADLIDSLIAQLTASQRREKAAVELMRKIHSAPYDGYCKSCGEIFDMIEAAGRQEAERNRGICGATNLPCSGCAPVCEHERPQEAEKGEADGN